MDSSKQDAWFEQSNQNSQGRNDSNSNNSKLKPKIIKNKLSRDHEGSKSVQFDKLDNKKNPIKVNNNRMNVESSVKPVIRGSPHKKVAINNSGIPPLKLGSNITQINIESTKVMDKDVIDYLDGMLIGDNNHSYNK